MARQQEAELKVRFIFLFFHNDMVSVDESFYWIIDPGLDQLKGHVKYVAVLFHPGLFVKICVDSVQITRTFNFG